jgi:alpha-mannosidase
MSYSKRAHIISHTHWDREWYLPYEKHHMRLVSLMDSLLDQLDQEPDFKSFYLDGQTIIIDDYLQVRPDQKDRLLKHSRDGRIIIGPWYILQDAFLTSGEANVRNMQVGHRDAKRYGVPAKIGYYPDTFGLVGQTPQLMRQSGIGNVFFGRGVKPTGFNNTVSDGSYESSFSELLWEGPDGSRVLGILFANWYSNGNEIPVDVEEARRYWERKLADAGKYAATRELLYMNGCDHQPVQLDLPEAIRTAQQLFPDVEFVHSNFADYLAAVEQSLDRELSKVKGELRSQRTDGWGTLVNTASARVYLKQMNQAGQALLEKVAEPLASLAHLLGQEYPHDRFTYAWKTLMQNHPHDSICGCSVDEVHREMVTRFEKSRHVAESIITDSVRRIADEVDTTAFGRWGKDVCPFVVFNTSGWERTGVVSVELDAARLYFREGLSLEETTRRMKEFDLSGRILVDSEGKEVACTVEDLGLQFGYDLPDDRFRQPYSCRRVRITFEAECIPALGLRTYAWVCQGGSSATSSAASSSLLAGKRGMENEWLKVDIADNGSFTVTDKQTGRSYKDLGIYENVGDIGNEYMFKQPDGTDPLTTHELRAEIQVLEDKPHRAAYEIIHHWEIPASADDVLDQEQRELIYYPQRTAQRSTNTVPLIIRTVVSLSRSGKGVVVEASFNNEAKDHRMRVLFPTNISSATHKVDSMFEVAVRDNNPASEWENPSNTQHQQAFVDVSDADAGLTVANQGLNEYEVLQDGRNTIAVTLLRAVGELGDWGLFPTPEAQCLGEHKVRLEIIPHNGDGITNGAYAEAYQFQIPWTVEQTGVHTGAWMPDTAVMEWSGAGLAFSSLKVNLDSGDLMLRWYNMSGHQTELSCSATSSAAGNLAFGETYWSNILEERIDDVNRILMNDATDTAPAQEWSVRVGPCEIVTVGIPKM